MASLEFLEKQKLERLFGMSSGYVLNFYNYSFRDFFSDFGIDIYDSKYGVDGTAKARRLRCFWTLEEDHLVGRVLTKLIELAEDQHSGVDGDKSLIEACKLIARRLCGSPIVGLTPSLAEQLGDDWVAVHEKIKSTIERGHPQAALNDLHTFLVRYIRSLFESRELVFDPGSPLHGIYASYTRLLKEEGTIRSDLAERLLRMNIQALEAFNWVKNKQSAAHHEEPFLDHDEAIFIVRGIDSLIEFIERIERKRRSSFASPS